MELCLFEDLLIFSDLLKMEILRSVLVGNDTGTHTVTSADTIGNNKGREPPPPPDLRIYAKKLCQPMSMQ